MVSVAPYWYKLIYHWVKEYKRNGLTIPFLIGAPTLINSEYKIEKNPVQKLFNDIMISGINDIIVLENCPTINEYILGLEYPPKSKNGLEIKNQKDETKIKVTFSAEILGTTLNEISSQLGDKYQTSLTQGLFSLNRFKWTPFTDEDIDMIRAALSK